MGALEVFEKVSMAQDEIWYGTGGNMVASLILCTVSQRPKGRVHLKVGKKVLEFSQ